MSKVIVKIGPGTEKVEQSDIITVSMGQQPRTTIKYAKDHSVVFFDRNPFYVTLTEPSEVGNVCKLLDLFQQDESEVKYWNMACANIESVLASYVASNLLEDFSETLINALKNSKAVGRRQAYERINGSEKHVPV